MYKKWISGFSAAAALAVAVTAGGIAPAQAAGVPESTDPIKLAINEWTGQHITTYVAGEVLKRMGYNVEYTTAGYLPQFEAIQDGTVTASLEIWSNNVGDAYDKAAQPTGKVVKLGNLGVEAGEAWYYPKYVEEKCPGLPDWQAFAKCAELFSTPETFPQRPPARLSARLGRAQCRDHQGTEATLTSRFPAAAKARWLRSSRRRRAQRADRHDVLDAALAVRPGAGCGQGGAAGFTTRPAWTIRTGARIRMRPATASCRSRSPSRWPGSAGKDKWPAAYRFLDQLHLLGRRPDPADRQDRRPGRRSGDGGEGSGSTQNEAKWKPDGRRRPREQLSKVGRGRSAIDRPRPSSSDMNQSAHVPSAARSKISCRNVWKVYGDRSRIVFPRTQRQGR